MKRGRIPQLLLNREARRRDKERRAAAENRELEAVPHAEALSAELKLYALPAQLDENMTVCVKCQAPVAMVTVRMKSTRGVTDRIRYLDLVGPHGLTISGRDSQGTIRNWVRRHSCRKQGT